MSEKCVIEGPCAGIDKVYPESSVADKCCYIPLVRIETQREKLTPKEIARHKAELEAEGKPFYDGWDEVSNEVGFACEEFRFEVGKKYRITIEEIV